MTTVQNMLLLNRLLGLLTDPPDHSQLRLEAGEALLNLFRADYFASYIWNNQLQRYDCGVMLNMSPQNLERYDQYFQFNDPITHRLQRRQQATDVGQIMNYRGLRKTQFYNDFLRVDGLYYGINGHAFDNRRHLGDIRIWRARHRPSFEREDLKLLEFIRPLFGNALKNSKPAATHDLQNRDALADSMARFGLTRREAEVADQLCRGLTDQQIAEQLKISYTTVRSHLKQLYRKLDVHSRSAAQVRMRQIMSPG